MKILKNIIKLTVADKVPLKSNILPSTHHLLPPLTSNKIQMIIICWNTTWWYFYFWKERQRWKEKKWMKKEKSWKIHLSCWRVENFNFNKFLLFRVFQIETDFHLRATCMCLNWKKYVFEILTISASEIIKYGKTEKKHKNMSIYNAKHVFILLLLLALFSRVQKREKWKKQAT